MRSGPVPRTTHGRYELESRRRIDGTATRLACLSESTRGSNHDRPGTAGIDLSLNATLDHRSLPSAEHGHRTRTFRSRPGSSAHAPHDVLGEVESLTVFRAYAKVSHSPRQIWQRRTSAWFSCRSRWKSRILNHETGVGHPLFCRSLNPSKPRLRPARVTAELGAAHQNAEDFKEFIRICGITTQSVYAVQSAKSRRRTRWPTASGRSSPSGIARWMRRGNGGAPSGRRVGLPSDLGGRGHCLSWLAALRCLMVWAEHTAPRRHDMSAVLGNRTERGRRDGASSFPSGLVRKRQIEALRSFLYDLV